MMRLHRHVTKTELYDRLASEWIANIQSGSADATPSFALAGGTTPAPIYRRFLERLKEIGASPARRIDLVATDERWVPNTDVQSNEGLIESCFHIAGNDENPCRLVSLKTGDASPSQAIGTVSHRLDAAFPGPFSAVLLGMGNDGHIASLFPGANSDDETGHAANCLPARHPVTEQPRMSLSMHRLLNTQRAWLVITGDEKLALLQNCERGKRDLPIAQFLQRAGCEVDVYWSPDSVSAA
jgi:6-phosphogluconolactonase